MADKLVAFDVGEEHIYGVLNKPLNYIGETSTFIIFLHGWAGYRIGPHNMFVEFSNQLVKKGFYCLRFDFRGRGYSGDNIEDMNYSTMKKDLDIVIENVKKDFKATQIILLGICSGARLGLHYILHGSYKVSGLIELSSAALFNEKDTKVELKKVNSFFRAYVLKLKKKNTWVKLFYGEINFSSILKTLWISIANILKQFHIKNKEEKGQILKSKISNFEGTVLMIHGEKDPETDLVTRQIQNYLETHTIEYYKRIIEGANHSFYSLDWKKEIFMHISDFLKPYERG
jgi:pimeloyl-ACP methyl ester carboxylesterase